MSRALLAIADHGELSRYLSQIETYPMLTVKEEFELAVRYQEEQDLEAAHQLVCAHLRYVVKIAREYSGYGLRIMDLIQEGSVGLMKAVKRFDPHKGFRLATYALWWIRATIQEYILNSWSLVKIGTTAARRKLFFNLRSCKATLDRLYESDAQVLGRKLGVNPQLVMEMDSRLSARDDTLNRPAIDNGEELQNLLPDPTDNQETLLLSWEADTYRKQAAKKALATLDDREKRIITQRIMTDHPATLDAIGRQLGISRERVRQLEKRALLKMRGLFRENSQIWPFESCASPSS